MQETNEALVAKIKAGIDVSDNMLRLWQQNERFIAMMANRYKGYEDIEDLKQQGYIGLSNAVEGYRKEENVSFINYAALWIRQSMIRYIDESGSLIRIPVYKRNEQQKYRRLLYEFELLAGRLPSDREICLHMEISNKKLESIRRYDSISRIDSLDRAVNYNGDEYVVGDFVSSEDDIEDEVLDTVQQEQLKNIIWSAVDSLPEVQSQVIRFRYQKHRTLKETAQFIKSTPERVRQLEYRALKEMQQKRRKNGLIEFVPEDIYRHNSVTEFNRTWTSSTELAALRIYEKSEV